MKNIIFFFASSTFWPDFEALALLPLGPDLVPRRGGGHHQPLLVRPGAGGCQKHDCNGGLNVMGFRRLQQLKLSRWPVKSVGATVLDTNDTENHMLLWRLIGVFTIHNSNISFCKKIRLIWKHFVLLCWHFLCVSSSHLCLHNRCGNMSGLQKEMERNEK